MFHCLRPYHGWMNSERVYFHGTEPDAARAILREGFRISDLRHGPALRNGRSAGAGVYVASKLESAANWGSVIIDCRLAEGTRILRVDEEYDVRVIERLRRRFGRDLFEPDMRVDRALPRNKELTRAELLELCCFLRARNGRMLRRAWRSPRSWGYLNKRRPLLAVDRLNVLLRRHQLDAVGDVATRFWDSDELVVFNASRLEPICARAVLGTKEDARGFITSVELGESLGATEAQR